MKDKKIVNYEELTIHFKRRVMLKYHLDGRDNLKIVKHEGLNTNAMEIGYQGLDYLVLIDDRSIPLIEWDSFQEAECEEELDSLIRLGYPDELPSDFNNLFYS